MRLHGWTSYSVSVYMNAGAPTERMFEALVVREDGAIDKDAWRGHASKPVDAIEDAFRSIGKE